MNYDEFKEVMLKTMKTDVCDVTREAMNLYSGRERSCKWEIIEYTMMRLKARGDYSQQGLFHRDALNEGFSPKQVAELIESPAMFAFIFNLILDTMEKEAA